jgi:WW domain-containing oxidoreductase
MGSWVSRSPLASVQALPFPVSRLWVWKGLARLLPLGPSGFGYGTTAREVARGVQLEGKVFLLTGAYSGLGAETLRTLLTHGGTVFALGRRAPGPEFSTEWPGRLLSVPLDLSDYRSIVSAVGQVRSAGLPLDAVILNSGIMAPPRLELLYGVEKSFWVNHVAHTALMEGLLGRLRERGRVVIVGSEAYQRARPPSFGPAQGPGRAPYEPWDAYGRSKLANLVYGSDLARRLAKDAPAVFILHPGVIPTRLFAAAPAWQRLAVLALSGLAFKSTEQGAATQVFLATHPSLEGARSGYYKNVNRASLPGWVHAEGLAAELRQVTEEALERARRENDAASGLSLDSRTGGLPAQA